MLHVPQCVDIAQVWGWATGAQGGVRAGLGTGGFRLQKPPAHACAEITWPGTRRHNCCARRLLMTCINTFLCAGRWGSSVLESQKCSVQISHALISKINILLVPHILIFLIKKRAFSQIYFLPLRYLRTQVKLPSTFFMIYYCYCVFAPAQMNHRWNLPTFSLTLVIKPPKRFIKLRLDNRAEISFSVVFRFWVLDCCWFICRTIKPAGIAAFSAITHQDKWYSKASQCLLTLIEWTLSKFFSQCWKMGQK